ncbi:hypothetical protein JCM3775_006692 [Rhodotorula graminis]|uniref:Uncharacterized protein n=1 Tax=Rhodotorula graminis (strain WP1) TaxID=578459 RepID=A0A194S957_RHOGW|nr:uncharacterized protein RHOBADRAFT_64661 [Rhodotorula graminis WP1]KPV77132.1 hypothetical protein RHOBADRAFT_64661 [Rhodotorula graminis WP1]
MFASPSSLLTSAFALLALSSAASAKSADGVFDGGKGAQSKIDYQPPFTAPKGGEVFIAGQQYTASWNQEIPSDVPAGNISKTADLVLGYDDEGSTSLHLNWTLASDLALYAPAPDSVTFVIPDDVPSRDTYFLVLLGSTRNQSPRFSVVGNILPSQSTGSEPFPLSDSPSSSSASSASEPSATESSATPSASAQAGEGEGDADEGLAGFFHGLGLRRVRRAEAGKARLDN